MPVGDVRPFPSLRKTPLTARDRRDPHGRWQGPSRWRLAFLLHRHAHPSGM